MSSSLLLALLVNRSPTERLIQNILNNPFAGIHQLAWFDWAMLIPYFTVLIILSVYGLHRYDIIRTYFKHKKKQDHSNRPSASSSCRRVTIQLPLYNERYVVERLIEETVKMDYPKELLQIQVLDDSTDDTAPFADALVERYRTLGYPIEYHHRTNRHGFKAGALQEGLKSATGEMVAVFDADFIPPTDFLTRTIHYFTDPKVGVVQTRWSYLNRDYNFLTEVEGMLLDGHFILEHGARSCAGYFFNFNGTAGILRVAMIADAGGWQHDTLTEDSDLSYRAQLKGWRFMYLPGLDCPSELPVEMHGFQVQQSRWAKGLTQVAMKLLPAILKAPISAPRQDGSLHAPDAQYHLSADDRGFGADAAGDDRALLHGRVADDVSGSAADCGVVLVDFAVLRGGAARALSQELEALDFHAAHADGGGRGTHDHQYARRAGSAVRGGDQLCAHAEIRHRRAPDEAGEQTVPRAAAAGCLTWKSRSERTSWAWWCLPSPRSISSRSRSCRCSCSDTTGPGSPRSIRSTRTACAG